MSEPHPLGHVARLWRYPTKSLRAEPLERAVVEPDGFARRPASRARRIDARTRTRTGRTYRGKEHNLLHTFATRSGGARCGASGAAWRSTFATTDRISTRKPISIVVDRWVAALEGARGPRARSAALSAQHLRACRRRVSMRTKPRSSGARSRSATYGSRSSAPIDRASRSRYDVATGDCEPRLAARARARTRQRDGYLLPPLVTGTIAVDDEIGVARVARRATSRAGPRALLRASLRPRNRDRRRSASRTRAA